MITSVLARFIILVFGTLYPAYASYKAVRSKNERDYLNWIMYWVVFAFFTCFETFTDVFLSWFPFYYELKVIIVVWLLSPVTEGSSVLYRNFVHPMLTKREKDIDEYINQAKEKSCTAFLQLGTRGVNYATNVIMQTAFKSYTFLSITNVENSQRGRDVVDYSFSELRELSSDEDDNLNNGAGCSGHAARSRVNEIVDEDLASFEFSVIDEQDEFLMSEESETESSNSSSGNLLEDTELISSDDEYDFIVTRGRTRAAAKKTNSKAAKTKAKPELKKTKPKEKAKTPTPRIPRATRASSVRF